MSSSAERVVGLSAPAEPARHRLALGDWMMIGGLLALYSPTLYQLLNGGLWASEEYSHGPLILAISLWLLWERWRAVEASRVARPPGVGRGWYFLAAGSLLYALGRMLGIVYFEVGSAIPMLAAFVSIARGPEMLRRLRFPLMYMIFMIPIPNIISGPVSEFLKTGVSVVTDDLLHFAGYPIARSGVILQLGQYQLLVANACAGMRTLFMLEALGVLYLELVRHASWFRGIALAILIVPISFAANVARVVILCLLTYYFGDEVGQGFLHGFAGIALFLCGLAFMVMADLSLRFFVAWVRSRA
jgi:exosortase B